MDMDMDMDMPHRCVLLHGSMSFPCPERWCGVPTL